MAYVTRYILEFSDFAKNENYRIRIRTQESLPVDFPECTDMPCTITWDAKDDKFGGVTGSELAISFYNDGYDLSPLFVVDPFGVEVLLEREDGVGDYHVVWRGFVNPETFTEDFSWDRGVVSIVANDGLAAIDRVKFLEGNEDGVITNPLQLGVAKLTEVIDYCISDLVGGDYGIDRIMTAIDIRGTSNTFNLLSIDLANFVNEDGISQTKREVLDWICESFSVNVTLFGRAIWLVDSCLMAASSYDAKGYNLSWVQQQNYDETIYPIDLSLVNNIEYDGSQTREYKAGYESITINYDPYATVRKLNGCSDLDGLNITNTPAWYVLDPWRSFYKGTFETVRKTPITFVDFEDPDELQMEDTTNQHFLQPAFCVPVGDTGEVPQDISSNRYVGIIAFSDYYSNPADVNSNSNYGATMYGGTLPITTDSIQLNLDSYFTWDIDSNPDLIDGMYRDQIETLTLRVGLIIKCGTKWATGGQIFPIPSTPNGSIQDNNITFDSAVENIVWLDVYSSSNGNVTLNEQLSITINGIPESGVLSIKPVQNNSVYTYYADDIFTWRTIPYGWAFGVRNPSAIINGREFNDDGVEENGSTGIEFKEQGTKDINISSKREQGCLDRGCLINTNDEHESGFYRDSFPQVTNMAGAVIQGYLGNYSGKYSVLNANLMTDDMLLSTPNREHSGILSPISPILDSNHTLTNNMVLTSGSFDFRNNNVTGVWSEVFNADITLT